MSSIGLVTLPTEILCLVASYLPLEDWKALRLSCRQIENCLRPAFGHRYFRERQVARTEPSLRVLVDISKSRLSGFVKSVFIVTDQTKEAARLRREFSAEADDEVWLLNKVNHDVFCDTGLDREMLIEAFSNLQLENVGVRRCFSRASATGTLLLEPEPLLEPSDSGYATLDSSFRVLLHVLGRTKTKPKRLEGRCLTEAALHIPPFMETSVIPILAELEELDIAVGAEDSIFRTFIGHTTLLRTLRLRSGVHDGPTMEEVDGSTSSWDLIGGKEAFFPWFVSSYQSKEPAPADARLCPTPRVLLAHLQRLELGGGTIQMQTMLAVIKKLSPTLECLRLVDLHLGAIVSPEVGATLNRAAFIEQAKRIWPDFLGKLIEFENDKITALRAISFARPLSEQVCERGGVSMAHSFRICNLAYESFHYGGPDMIRVLNGLLKSMTEPGHWYWYPDDERQLRGKWDAEDVHDGQDMVREWGTIYSVENWLDESDGVDEVEGSSDGDETI